MNFFYINWYVITLDVFCIIILDVYSCVAAEVKQYTSFCLEIFSIEKYPYITLPSKCLTLFYYYAYDSLYHIRGSYAEIIECK